MAQSNFVDYVKIFFKSGHGGAGSAHFHRAKYVPKGGPDGGNGGRGGDIILEGDENTWTLLPLKYKKHIFAGNGEGGGKNNMTGADGEDIILKVPPGTIAKDFETGEIELEITEHGERKVLLKGGRGGLGNTNFKSSTNQAPRYSQPGEEGEEGWKILELKVLADVGLVGFPNAGKSTLLSVLSAAKPKIADYPFTTLVPNLGIVNYRNIHSFVIADIPGIIQGASEGKGLGYRFLRHIERNAILLFMVSAEAEDITARFNILLKEVTAYKEELAHKSRLLVISKADLIDEELKVMLLKELHVDIPVVFISSVTQMGLDELKDDIWALLEHQSEEE